MNRLMPRVAAIHDLSGFGRCSLTTAISILSVMGIQVCPLPAAILSSHSDGLGNFSFLDFTPYMKDFINHWQEMDLEFSCIYTGFLSSCDQIEIVSKFIDDFKIKKEQLIVVDPVMGDEGKFYVTHTEEMGMAMLSLVKKANVITPNITEACLLLQKPYENRIYSHSEAKWLLKELAKLGPNKVVVTDVPLSGDRRGNLGYNKEEDLFIYVPIDYVPEIYPGTGDIYASVLTGSIIMGEGLDVAMDKATVFVEEAAKSTYKDQSFKKEGVAFEKILGHFFIEPYKKKFIYLNNKEGL